MPHIVGWETRSSSIFRDRRPLQCRQGHDQETNEKISSSIAIVGHQGQPPLLNETQPTRLRRKIYEAYEQRHPLSIVEVAKFISAEFGLNILPNTLDHILSRDPAIKSCKAIPMDVKRAEVTVDDIRAHFTHLFTTISSAPDHLMFNMDEMRHQELNDSTEKVCFVPVYYSEDLVYYPVSRTGKRITLLACIAADGSFLKPAVVIPRKIDNGDLLLFRITPEKVELYS
jgi:hypothetical protein